MVQKCKHTIITRIMTDIYILSDTVFDNVYSNVTCVSLIQRLHTN